MKGWKTGGHERRLVARIVNYADDFVICCRGTAEPAMVVMRGMMSKLKLTVNETKTRSLPPAGGDVRLPGLHPGPELRPSHGRALLGTASVAEEDRPALRRDQ